MVVSFWEMLLCLPFLSSAAECLLRNIFQVLQGILIHGEDNIRRSGLIEQGRCLWMCWRQNFELSEKPQNSSPNNSGLFLFEHTGPLVQLGKIKASLLPSAKQCPFDGTCQMGLSPFYDMSLQFHTTNIVVVCITLVV